MTAPSMVAYRWYQGFGEQGLSDDLIPIVVTVLATAIVLPAAEFLWRLMTARRVMAEDAACALRIDLRERESQIDALRRQLVASKQKKTVFTYEGVVFATSTGQKLDVAKRIHVVFHHCLLRNPDPQRTAVRFCLQVGFDDGTTWLAYEPLTSVSGHVLEGAEKRSASRASYLFSTIENIDGRFTQGGWLVFELDELALEQVDQAGDGTRRMQLEIKDLQSEDVQLWNATGTLMRLATKRGKLPKPEPDG